MIMRGEPCCYCIDGPDNIPIDHRINKLNYDIHVRINSDGVLVCKHRDNECGFYDERIDIPINFCPVCGRALKK